MLFFCSENINILKRPVSSPSMQTIWYCSALPMKSKCKAQCPQTSWFKDTNCIKNPQIQHLDKNLRKLKSKRSSRKVALTSPPPHPSSSIWATEPRTRYARRSPCTRAGRHFSRVGTWGPRNPHKQPVNLPHLPSYFTIRSLTQPPGLVDSSYSGRFLRSLFSYEGSMHTWNFNKMVLLSSCASVFVSVMFGLSQRPKGSRRTPSSPTRHWALGGYPVTLFLN